MAYDVVRVGRWCRCDDVEIGFEFMAEDVEGKIVNVIAERILNFSTD